MYRSEMAPAFTPPHWPADFTLDTEHTLGLRWDPSAETPGLLVSESSAGVRGLHHMEMHDGLLITGEESPFLPLAAYLGVRTSHTCSTGEIIKHRKEMQYPYAPGVIASLNELRRSNGHFLAGLRAYHGRKFSAEQSVEAGAEGAFLWSTEGYDTLHDTAEHIIPFLSMTEEIVGRHQERCQKVIRTARDRQAYVDVAEDLDSSANGLWLETLHNALAWEDESAGLEAPQNAKTSLLLDSLGENIGSILNILAGEETTRLARDVHRQARWLLNSVRGPST